MIVYRAEVRAEGEGQVDQLVSLAADADIGLIVFDDAVPQGPSVFVVDRLDLGGNGNDALYVFSERANAERFRDAVIGDGGEAVLSEEPFCDSSTANLIDAVIG